MPIINPQQFVVAIQREQGFTYECGEFHHTFPVDQVFEEVRARIIRELAGVIESARPGDKEVRMKMVIGSIVVHVKRTMEFVDNLDEHLKPNSVISKIVTVALSRVFNGVIRWTFNRALREAYKARFIHTQRKGTDGRVIRGVWNPIRALQPTWIIDSHESQVDRIDYLTELFVDSHFNQATESLIKEVINHPDESLRDTVERFDHYEVVTAVLI